MCHLQRNAGKRCQHGAALKSRRLVRTSGRGPTWQAEVTPEGLDLLEGAARVERGQLESSDSLAELSPAGGPVNEERSSLERPRRPRALSPTEQLIADLVAAGGVLAVPSGHGPGEADYGQRLRSAQRFGKVPGGKAP